tara:strand:+ start:142 stop:555 length:414 start_codon:yes stop_codon:yes gene_type:complete
MLQINKQVDYALQLMLALSDLEKGEYLSLRTFAKTHHISFLFLQKIAIKLRKNALISAKKGVNGGYYLLDLPKAISFKHILEAIEGSYAPVSCLPKESVCALATVCKTQSVFSIIQKDIVFSMEKYTLAYMRELRTK